MCFQGVSLLTTDYLKVTNNHYSFNYHDSMCIIMLLLKHVVHKHPLMDKTMYCNSTFSPTDKCAQDVKD